MREPMSSVDAAWFRMDRPENTADVVALLAFRELPPFDQVRRCIEERLLACARFRQRAFRGPPGRDAWEDDHFGLVFLDLPTDVAAASGRLLAVRERTALLKQRPDAVATFAVLSALGRIPAVEPWATRFFSRKASVVITNVPGPREPLHLAGRRIDHAMFWVPHPATLGVGVSILSYAGEVRIGVRADVAVMPEPADLVERFEEEVAALGADYRGAGRSSRSASRTPASQASACVR
jgi:WS/DGAT C-terminal domain